ncbi:PEP/pyruvate-binding domain-containing protein [Bradyrhizobium sp. OAE829]|uniref:PEP/pyruvate-binding domain-containing protein n=1 Tax=Bradyrhizobium sp. OAE829 TaxID=2663807 RepID=UPI0017895C4D
MIILGAGRPSVGRKHSALRVVGRDRKTLDWILHAFKKLVGGTVFVGGYEMQSVLEAFPGVDFVLNSAWNETGAARSLLAAPIDEDRDCYVCYSDIVLRPELARKMADAPDYAIVVAIDSQPEHETGIRRTERETIRIDEGRAIGVGMVGPGRRAEFIGAVRFPAHMMPALRTMKVSADPALRQGHLSAIVGALIADGHNVHLVDGHGCWSDLDDDRDLTRFLFGTKAETLERLRERISRSIILEQVRIDVGRWNDDAQACLREISSLGTGPFAVRSSALAEDSFASSNAGRFKSKLDVQGNEEALREAIAQVIGSYDGHDAANQVLVQRMVGNVRASGVVLTRTGRIGGPYITVAWTEGDRTDDVTSGRAQDQRTLVSYRGASTVVSSVPRFIADVIEATREIEDISDNDTLDLEFAVDHAGRVFVLQVRPLVIAHERTSETDGQVMKALSFVESQMKELATLPPSQVGDRTIWGVMPDWNPAEIIGIRPGRLAFDLYRRLITDEVWARQRAEYGYRNVGRWPLVRRFAGHAYVDVRASFNSFVPAVIDEGTTKDLVNACLDRLERNPELHDKVEFEVVPTAWSFDLDAKLTRLADEAGHSRERFAAMAPALADITASGIRRAHGDLQGSLTFSSLLDKRLDAGAQKNDLSCALALIDLCGEHGTLPFAHLARGAFVAMTLLRSAVREQVLSHERVENFLQSISTVSQDFVSDAVAVRSGNLTFAEFAGRYGHLRPGTYDIASACYAEMPDRFLKPIVDVANVKSHVEHIWTLAEANALTSRLCAAGIDVEMDTLDAFFRESIQGRELSKFVFTRALSEALNIISNWGVSIGMSREQLANLELSDLVAFSRGIGADAEQLRTRADAGAEESQLACFVELPTLICRAGDLYSFEHQQTQPNFVTGKSVTAPGIALRDDDAAGDLAGKIVIVPRADPGFDWIFGHRIAGLVTMYGGANSHMAIRSAEFGLPAAIGIGESRYKELVDAPLVELNCRERRLSAVARP